MVSIKEIPVFVKHLGSTLHHARIPKRKENSFIIHNYDSCALKREQQNRKTEVKVENKGEVFRE